MATETVKKLFVSMNCERRCLFRMKWAKPLKTGACSLQTYVVRNHFDDIGRIANRFGEVVHLGCRDPKKRNQTRYTVLAENIKAEFWVPNGSELGHPSHSQPLCAIRPGRPFWSRSQRHNRGSPATLGLGGGFKAADVGVVAQQFHNR